MEIGKTAISSSSLISSSSSSSLERPDQLECRSTDPARNDFWELAGKCLGLTRARG